MCGAKMEDKFQMPKIGESFLNRPTIKRKALESWDLKRDSNENSQVKYPRWDTNNLNNKNEKIV